MSSSEDMSVEGGKAPTKEVIVKTKTPVDYSSDSPKGQYDKRAGIKKEIKIFKLNANNYRTWATMMKMNFDDRNL